MTTAEPGPYHHADARELNARQLHMLVVARQSQRLMLAQEAHTIRQRKLEGIQAKELERYTKLDTAVKNRLAKIEEELRKCRADMNKMQAISSTISLTQQEIKL